MTTYEIMTSAAQNAEPKNLREWLFDGDRDKEPIMLVDLPDEYHQD